MGLELKSKLIRNFLTFLSRLVYNCKKRLEMLLGYNVKPILIFDGAKL